MLKHRRLRYSSLAAAGVAAAFLVTGCSMEDAICSNGEYPVKAVGGTTGSACVPDDEEPPKGYVRYPKGKVPEHVDDKWDKYWSTVVVDENGNVVTD
ncbi:SCO0607 family lipoprotein [Streptomyces sp. NBC_00467]|uniref:SCO0607 family lipoprotein n=1 Tax=Streptomyces sp. NBC_00467 TaxID=2975752 RepID=UPI002E17A2AA